ncbi:hypothetical protein F5880DRAFT_1493173 [Lentinula raphanica]|nr:hypothetical protein F5880DRAFT_1493173 [Lentinula raphanica]
MRFYPPFSSSLLLSVVLLVLPCLNWHAYSIFCRASTPTSLQDPNISGPDALTLQDEFRRHYHHFQSVLNQISQDDTTDVFHILLLGEDLEEYANLVAQSHHGRPNIVSWEHSGSAGRPRAIIDPSFLQWAHGRRSTSGIAYFLGLSTRTVRRSLLEYGIVSPGHTPFADRMDANNAAQDDRLDPETLPPEVQNAANAIQSSSSSSRLSNMSNDDLDTMIQLLRSHYPSAGIRILDGMLRRLGHVVPYERIRQSLMRINPVQCTFDRIRIRRRRYTVPGPNSLWHHDGHHRKSLQSVHNVRIERLWVDVSNYITQPWNDIFSGLEQRYHLDISNPNHIWLLQYLFMDTINIILSFWAEGWNNHRITQRDGPSRSPEDMWGFDMLVHGIRGDSVDDFSMSDQELADFGVDWEDLEDEALLQSLRRNYAHEEGASTWLGRHGPPPVLNEVHVEPPSGLMTTAEIQALDSFLEPISQISNEGDAIRLWCMALAYVRALYPDYF